MLTDDLRLSLAWNSVGVAWNPSAAFQQYALAHQLGRPVGNETTSTIDGVQYRSQGYELAFVQCIVGDWPNLKAYSWKDGKEFVPGTPAPVITPPTSTPRLTSVPPLVMPDGTKVDLGMKIIPYQPQPGETFWGIVAIGAYKLGVGTQIVLTARDAQGARFDVPITHAWDPGRQKSETVLTDGDGKRTIILGHGSDYTPPTPPPDRIYVSKGDGQDGSQWPTPAGDIWVCGEPGGHFEGAATFQLMVG